MSSKNLDRMEEEGGAVPRKMVSLIVHNFLRIHSTHSQVEYYFHVIIL